MSKDYAKRANQKSYGMKGETRKWSGILWFFAGILLSISVIAYFIIYKGGRAPLHPMAQQNKTHTPIVKTEQKPRFEFYTMLPKMKVPSPVEEGDSEKSPVLSAKAVFTKPSSKKTHYLLQVASFQKNEEADRLKAALLLQGYRVAVVKGEHGSQAWYRVQIGPFADFEKAKEAQHALRQSVHVTGLIKRTQNG